MICLLRFAFAVTYFAVLFAICLYFLWLLDFALITCSLEFLICCDWACSFHLFLLFLWRGWLLLVVYFDKFGFCVFLLVAVVFV